MEPVSTTKLSSKQRQVIKLIVEGNLESEICEKLKIHRATIHRWKQEPDFKVALEKEIAAFYADETYIKVRMRAKAWMALEKLVNMGSSKAVVKAFELTSPPPDAADDTNEYVIEIGEGSPEAAEAGEC